MLSTDMWAVVHVISALVYEGDDVAKNIVVAENVPSNLGLKLSQTIVPV
jgi:hypothetical protein